MTEKKRTAQDIVNEWKKDGSLQEGTMLFAKQVGTIGDGNGNTNSVSLIEHSPKEWSIQAEYGKEKRIVHTYIGHRALVQLRIAIDEALMFVEKRGW